MIKAIVIDDDLPSIRVVEHFIGAYPEVELIGSFTDPAEALARMESSSPHIVFLDIRMGALSGMDTAKKILAISPDTDIIFTTAYDNYAIEAFEINATDYLVKPIMKPRFDLTMQRVLKKHAPPETDHLRVTCFGKFTISRPEAAPVRWRTEKSKELAALLVHHRGSVVSRDEIIELLWPDTEPSRAARYLHNSIYYIRKSLEGYKICPSVMKIAGSYSMMLSDSVEVDYDQYEKLYSKADKSLADLEALYNLLKHDFMEGEDWDWVLLQREILQKRCIEIALRLGRLYFKAEEFTKAESVLRKAYLKDPYEEHTVEVLLRFYMKSGQKAAALRLYEEYEHMMRHELGIPPEEHIKKLVAPLH
jgi:two-component SAPR family response regulator